MSIIEKIIQKSNFDYGIQVMREYLESEESAMVSTFKLDVKLEKRLKVLFDSQAIDKRQQLSDASGRRRVLSDIRKYTFDDLKNIARRLKGINPVLGIPLCADDIAVDRYIGFQVTFNFILGYVTMVTMMF